MLINMNFKKIVQNQSGLHKTGIMMISLWCFGVWFCNGCSISDAKGQQSAKVSENDLAGSEVNKKEEKDKEVVVGVKAEGVEEVEVKVLQQAANESKKAIIGDYTTRVVPKLKKYKSNDNSKLVKQNLPNAILKILQNLEDLEKANKLKHLDVLAKLNNIKTSVQAFVMLVTSLNVNLTLKDSSDLVEKSFVESIHQAGAVSKLEQTVQEVQAGNFKIAAELLKGLKLW